MNSDPARDSTPPLDFDQFMASLRDSENVAPIISAPRFAAALHIDMQTLARLAHVHRNTVSRLAGSESVQKYLRDALRVIRAATDISGDVRSTLFWYRQIEAVEMMVAANKFTASYAEMILVATRGEALIDGAKPKKKDEISSEDLAKMERIRQDSQAVEDEIGDTMLSLVVAKSFMARLLRNDNIHGHLRRYHSDLLASLVSTMGAIAADNRITERE